MLQAQGGASLVIVSPALSFQSGAHRFRLVYSMEHESIRGRPSERLTTVRRREASTRDCEDAKVERQPRPRRPDRDWPPGKRVRKRALPDSRASVQGVLRS